MKKQLLTLSILAAATTLSQAALVTWTGGAGNGFWGDTGNWDTSAVPNPAQDDVLINNGDAVTRGGNLTFKKTLEVSGGSSFVFSAAGTTTGDMIATSS